MTFRETLDDIVDGMHDPFPSSQRVFTRNGVVEEVALIPCRSLESNLGNSTPLRRFANGTAQVVNRGLYGAIKGISHVSELTLRYSGRIVRATTRKLGELAALGYEHLPPHWQENIAQQLNRIQDAYHEVRSELPRPSRAARDLSMVTLSLIFATYLGIKTFSGGEEAPELPPQNQTAEYAPDPHYAAPKIFPKPAPKALPAPSASQTYSIEDIAQRLAPRYGEEVANYIARVIENGDRIRSSPSKDAELHGNIKGKLEQEFPGIPAPRLFGYFDEVRDAENLAQMVTARERVLQRADTYKRKLDLPLTFIVAALANEGHSLDVEWNSQILDGFANYGLDMFATEFPHIVERGYLPKDFKFRKIIRQNELGKRVESASFYSKQDAFEAFIATLAYRQDLLRGQLKKYGIPVDQLSQEELLFFNYHFYNGAPSAKRIFRKGVAQVHQYFSEVSGFGVKGNAYVVLSGHEWLERSGAFDANPGSKYFWCKK